ncbi:NADH dehydrogenase [ubiquinone] complex I, assembly factor 7 [Acipenser ruthenus]|uniref:Protein arginine methyltransferase NDUFAF7 n=1 Tax=Acipenser ruthenus TaxID=7906 RepID=A0A444ULP9_ACIRT|nr:NADH dehydrogenase [ubiquinone] complex I, assembly factor 7 [Acipenser ruthenus]
MAAGKPKEFQLVEFGPGRGIEAAEVSDGLTVSLLFPRVLKQLKSVVGESAVSVHLVEVSPKLSEVQAQSLTGEDSKAADNENDPVYRRGTTKTGHPVYWYRGMEDVPRGFSIYLAHEFFDALPIHKFQKTDKGWREILIDIDPEVANKLRFVLAPSATLASSTLLQADEEREHVEVCPEGGVLVQRLTNRISEDGGAALIADYGHAGDKTDTFRGFRGHKLHDVLVAPGTADLTADVDFRYLRRMTDERVLTFGPITQQQFLRNMGIDVRLQVLLRSCTDSSTRKQLVQGFDMMMNPEKMGERFKFVALVPHSRIAVQTRGKKAEQKGGAAPPVSGFSELGL